MTDYAKKANPLPGGNPLKEVTPTSLQSNFEYTFPAAAPVAPAYLAPGGVVNVGAPNASNWLIHTRSVLSWSIRCTDPFGCVLVVALDLSEYTPLVSEPPHWLPITIQGENVWNVGSGLELPGNAMARFILVSADFVNQVTVTGTIYLRSL